MDYLIRQGIDSYHLNAVAYGSSRPCMSNETKEGRLANRRVDLMVKLVTKTTLIDTWMLF
jgi:outer membrane protein OmpA-like peptidoglycan-associated protein